jgi:hypothetical protein
VLVALSSIPVEAKEAKVPVCVIPVYPPDILADGIVPLAKSDASKFVKLAPLIAGSVAGNLASGTVPLSRLSALRLATENVP